jgi:hypothetical protein
MDDGTDEGMDERMDGWMESFISSTTSFNIYPYLFLLFIYDITLGMSSTPCRQPPHSSLLGLMS